VVFLIGGSSRIGFEWIRMIQRIDVDNYFEIVAIDVLSLSIFLGTLTHEWQKTVGDAAAHGGSTVLIQWRALLQTTCHHELLFSVAVTVVLSYLENCPPLY